MKKSNETKFNEMKFAILEKVIPYYTNPAVYPMPKLSMEECAILLSPDFKHSISKNIICNTERSALKNIKRYFVKLGITSISDTLYSNSSGRVD